MASGHVLRLMCPFSSGGTSLLHHDAITPLRPLSTKIKSKVSFKMAQQPPKTKVEMDTNCEGQPAEPGTGQVGQKLPSVCGRPIGHGNCRLATTSFLVKKQKQDY
jgi:hypothetical protein